MSEVENVQLMVRKMQIDDAMAYLSTRLDLSVGDVSYLASYVEKHCKAKYDHNEVTSAKTSALVASKTPGQLYILRVNFDKELDENMVQSLNRQSYYSENYSLFTVN